MVANTQTLAVVDGFQAAHGGAATARTRPASARPRDRFARIRSALVSQNIDLAHRIAGRMARRIPAHLSDDVHSAALLGLVEAASRFHPGRGESFAAFAAKRVRGAVLDELRRGDVLPRRARKSARQVREAIRQLEHTLGRPPRDEEIAQRLGVDVEHYQERLAGLGSVEVVSLEQTQVGVREPADNPAEQTERNRAVARLGRACGELAEREAQVVAMYYDKQMTLAEIGRTLGVTESRVCQIHTRAIKRLRAEMGTAA